jgi:hypothetical protein
MKIKTSLAAALILTGSLAGSAMAADDGILLKEELTPGSGYCHMQFPAITRDSLFTDHPVLKSANSDDIIDYYGSCNENPVGQDQVMSQRDQYEENQRHSEE